MLKRCYRLTKRGSFTYLYNKGERKSDRLLSLVFISGKNLKVGFSIPNKIGKAHVRNLLKRRLRAYVRGSIPYLRPAQIVISARPGAQELTYLELCKSVKELFTKAKLFKMEGGKD